MVAKLEITAAAAQEAFTKAGTYRGAGKLLGVDEKTAKRILAKAGTVKVAPVAAVKAAGRDLSEFREKYDKNFIVPKRIKEALKNLGKGWMPEAEFAKAASIGLADLGNFRSLFEDHIVIYERTKRGWFGSQSVAKEAREMVS